jgi:N-acetylglucosamine-6-phosphate deacetylase
VRISRQIMGDRLFFITDAVTEIDRGEYRHVFKKDHYTLEDGTLSGSALNMIQSIRNAVEKAGIPIADALKMGSTNPARLIGDSHLGVIREGLKADFLVIGPQSEIRGLIGNGQ